MKSVRIFPGKSFCLFVLIGICALAVGADSNAAVDWQAKAGGIGPDPNDIAVIVNGKVITEASVQAQMKPQLQQLSQRNFPPQFAGQLKSQIRNRTIEKFIVEQLLSEQVEKKNVVVTDQNVIDYLKRAGAQKNMSLDDIKQLFKSQGRSFEQVKQQMKNSKGMKFQKLIDAQLEGKLNFTIEDAQQYYTENKDKFKKPERVKARHILIRPDPNIEPNLADAKAKEQAQKLLKRIKQDGADFAALAKQHSDDKYNAERGGEMGYFPRGEMVPPFDEAAFNLKVGQVSDLVKTRFGYHIINVLDHQQSSLTSFEQAEEAIMNQLKNQKRSEIAKQYIDSLKQKADIEYPPGKEPEPTPPAPMMRPAPKPEPESEK